ncbi:myozenin-3 [Ascaphus truei]|uniref:myozenin-3 n=1 Tax=Ascaphus truei TaxID=8439 RepID=UPI003F5A4B40
MFPYHSEMTKEQKARALAIVREISGEVPNFDLGKKVSTPQDVMMEELSLQRNRGSCMYLERQKRVQRFTFEYPSNRVNTGSNLNNSNPDQTATGDTSGTERVDGKDNYGSEIHTAPGGSRTAPHVPKKSAKVLQMKMALNPGAIAPGYSGPLKGIPYERFNITAIPKSYSSPWVEKQNAEPTISIVEALPDAQEIPLNVMYRSFNRAPIPFGSFSAVGRMAAPSVFEELQAQIDEVATGEELMCQRPSFNRAPRGWTMKFIPESVDL